MQTNTGMPTSLNLSGLAEALARGYSTNTFFTGFEVNVDPLGRGVTGGIFDALGTKAPTGAAVLQGQSSRQMGAVDVVIGLITEHPQLISTILSEMRSVTSSKQFTEFVGRLVAELRARGVELPIELQYTVPDTVATDEEIEAMGVAALSAGINPGAGHGGFSLTNEGGVATIGPTGNISWAGMNGGPIGIAGAHSQFSTNAALAAAIASLFSSLFGTGRTDNAPTATPPDVTVDNPQGPEPGEI